MNVHAKFLRTDQLRHLLSPVLSEGLMAYGFHSIDVREDETADGLPILRVIAHVARAVPAEKRISAMDAAHAALRSEGEERIIFLTTPSGPEAADPADDGDED